MAQVTGPSKSFMAYSYDMVRGNHHAIINYTISISNTAVTVTIQSIQEYTEVHYGKNNSNRVTCTAVLATSGYSNSNYSVEIRSSYSGVTTTLASNLSFSWSRGTSAQTKTISLTTSFANLLSGESSVATLNVSIPALASYAVTYNANGGSGAPGAQTKYYGINLALSSVTPSKSGYTFKGWASSEANAKAGTVNYNKGATYTSNAVLALWAVWELTYIKPTISGLSIERCRSDGTLDDEGDYANVTFNWAVFRSALARYYNGNTTPYSNNSVSACTITITNGTITKTATPTLSGASNTGESVIVGDGTFDTDEQYSVTIVITDSQSVYNDKTTTLLGVLARAAFPMDINADGTAVGFLMPAPDNAKGVYFGEDIKIVLPNYQTSGESDKNIYDAIVAKGWSSYVLDGNIVSLKKLLEKMLS